MSNQLAMVAPSQIPALIASAGDRAGIRFLEFFAGANPQPAHQARLCRTRGRTRARACSRFQRT